VVNATEFTVDVDGGAGCENVSLCYKSRGNSQSVFESGIIHTEQIQRSLSARPHEGECSPCQPEAKGALLRAKGQISWSIISTTSKKRTNLATALVGLDLGLGEAVNTHVG
jgi:hypothetical protein